MINEAAVEFEMEKVGESVVELLVLLVNPVILVVSREAESESFDPKVLERCEACCEEHGCVFDEH